MKKARVTVTLTLREAKALAHAAGNVMDYSDALEAAFPDGQSRASAQRAYDRLLAAIRESSRKDCP